MLISYSSLKVYIVCERERAYDSIAVMQNLHFLTEADMVDDNKNKFLFHKKSIQSFTWASQ